MKIKSYVTVFVCFAANAVHLELVTDLTTTKSCLEAIKWLSYRRGLSKTIYSDNGTNFIGAISEIIKMESVLLSREYNNRMEHVLSNIGIDWLFSPPRSPHFGCPWEASEKSFEHHLCRTGGNCLYTYEQS